MADADSKACRKCGLLFPLSSFNKAPHHADGISSICRACHAKACSARYHQNKALHPLSPTAICEHCGGEFLLPQPKKYGDPPRNTKHCSVECRFWSKVDKSGGPEACWPWIAKALANFGYGSFRIAGKSGRSNRVAWELTNGTIPDGLCVLHRCDNPKCCNPAHFFLGTRLENVADMIKKGRKGVMSDEGKKRLIASKVGSPRPPHVGESVRRAHLGRKHSEEEKQKRAEANRGQKRSEESKQKMRDAWILRKAKAQLPGI